MRHEILAHLHDAVRAGQTIKDFVAGSTFDKYATNELLRSVVERKFEFLGFFCYITGLAVVRGREDLVRI